MGMWKYVHHTLVGASGLSLILIMTLSNLSSTAALLPPTLETSLSDNNLIFDKVLSPPSIAIGIQRTAILEANFTAQFESNSSDASVDWAFFGPPKCSFTLHEARFGIIGYLSLWTYPIHRHYIMPGVDYLFGNETGTFSSTGDRQVITYHFALGRPIREMQTVYSPYYPSNLTIRKDLIPVIIGGFADLGMNCGVQNTGYTYFADMKVSNQLQAATEVELSVPSDATITFFSSNLVRLRPNVFWLPLTDSVQRFYVQYDLTPWYLLSPTRDFIVGSVTGFLTAVALQFLTWTFRSVRARKSKRKAQGRDGRLEWYLD
jgi:hypothetical protein